MAVTKWLVTTALQTLLSTGLNSLANNAEATSAEYDNTSSLDLYADFVLALQWDSTPPSAGARAADVYLIPAVDGTNFATVGSDGLPQKGLFIGTFESRAPSTTTTEYLALSGIPIPPLKFKVVLTNVSGQTYKSSGNTLKMQPYQIQSV